MAIATTTAILIGAAVVAGGAAGGAAISAEAAKKAAEAQATGATEAATTQERMLERSIAAQREMFDLNREDLAPYREAGEESLGYLRDLNQPGEDFQRDFTTADFETDPGYQFRLSEGMKALDRSASARGNLLSGRQLKDVQRFGQGLASDEYGRAYSRFNADRDRRFNRFAAQAGVGQTAITQDNAFQTGANIGSTISSTGARLSEIQLQAANARASGYSARGNIYGSTLRDIGRIGGQTIVGASR